MLPKIILSFGRELAVGTGEGGLNPALKFSVPVQVMFPLVALETDLTNMSVLQAWKQYLSYNNRWIWLKSLNWVLIWGQQTEFF